MNPQAQENKTEFINKLPQITAAFWFLKITATTLGETGGDWLSQTMDVGYLKSTLIFLSLFVVALSIQFATKKFHAYLYWTVIVATSTVGTTMSDYMDRTLQLGYAKGAALLISILILLLAMWRLTIGNLSVDHIRTRKAETFYWITILFSNTLGTALGDFLSDDSGLGFFGSWLLITSLLLIIVALKFFTKLPGVFLFWPAFIMTRPFGATFGDLLTKATDKGGLDLGTGYASVVFLLILVISIPIFNSHSTKK